MEKDGDDMKKIIAISAGHDATKKADILIRKRIRYLNYGLLGLATILKHNGNLDVVVYQADSYSVEELFAIIEDSGINLLYDCECFLLSIPSYYSMSWSVRFCRAAKQRYNKPIIVGGRWVVDNHVEWVKDQLIYADTIIEGFGERKLAEYFRFRDWESIPDGKTKCFDWFDYQLLYDYHKYQPCIEVSRGCGSGCQFCADKDNKRLRNKPVKTILSELDKLDSFYGDYSVYFEAPHFVFEREWTQRLCNSLQSRKRQVLWRCTSRVETVPLDMIEVMSMSGLKVLDIGLESASHQQLINMHKTKDPKKYLSMAEKLLLTCAKYNVWVKFNLLLYAGETIKTIDETIKWLVERKELIKDVSVSSLVYYYNMDSILELQHFGASIPGGESVAENGFVNLNLSEQIDRETASQIALEIPKLIANQRDFYDIKSISYFEPGYTYSEFLSDLALCNRSELPFTVDLGD
ncbi:MAG: radical SAM protein [Clostridia bacterium]|nr:radical SAM protein [Clostridia bacterium]MBR5948143.1 radical SAM protein [Clostridia bacterium]